MDALYLTLHALTSLIAVVTVVVYTDRRITRLEENLKIEAKVHEYLEKRMDRLEAAH